MVNKNRVIWTFAFLLFLTGVIFFIQSNTQERVTGLSISDISPAIGEQTNVGNTNQFSLKIDHYSLNEGIMSVFYEIEDRVGMSKNLEVSYFIHDSTGREIQSGKESVLLQSGKNMDYSVSFKINNNLPDDSYITLVASNENGEQRASVPLILSSNPLTGNVVGEHRTKAFTFFGVMVIGLIVLFYAIRLVYINRIKKNLEEAGMNGRFIPIHYDN